MKKLTACSGLCLLVFSLSYYFVAATRENSAMAKEANHAAAGKMEMVAHNVYFSLKDNSGSAKQKMVDACKKYLSGHPGTVFFAAGILADDFDRPVTTGTLTSACTSSSRTRPRTSNIKTPRSI